MEDFVQSYTEYLRGIVALKIWHVWDLSRKATGGAQAGDALDRYVDIWRKTKHSDGKACPTDAGFFSEQWNQIKMDLLTLFRKHEYEPDSRHLEKDCLRYLWPLMEPTIEERARPSRKGADRPYGCWTYTLREGHQLSIHIENVYRPDSPFEHMEEFADDLLRMIRDVKPLHPELDTLFCGSWLNNVPVFQALFPAEWPRSFSEPVRLNNSPGIWGQYMERRGGFHHGNAERFRDSGEHPHPLVTAFCPLERACAYLERKDWESRIPALSPA